MFVVRDRFGNEICARCGSTEDLTIDHFISKRCGYPVDRDGNKIKICYTCNQLKAGNPVLPSWYTLLEEDKQRLLSRYVRYTRSWIVQNTDNQELIDYANHLCESQVEL